MPIRPTMADLLDGAHIPAVRADPAVAATIMDALRITGPLAHAGAVWGTDDGRISVNYRWESRPIIRLKFATEIAVESGIPTAADTPIPD